MKKLDEVEMRKLANEVVIAAGSQVEAARKTGLVRLTIYNICVGRSRGNLESQIAMQDFMKKVERSKRYHKNK